MVKQTKKIRFLESSLWEQSLECSGQSISLSLLAHMIMERLWLTWSGTGSHDYGKRWQVQNLQGEELMLEFKSKGHLLAGFPLAGEGQSSVLLRPPVPWMRSTHFMEDNLLYSKFSDLNVNLIQDILRETSRIMFDHTSGNWGLVKLAHKTDHHTLFAWGLLIL